MHALFNASQDIITEAVFEYEPSHIFCFFSGGYDSLATTLFSTAVIQRSISCLIPSAVVHINTGIGIPQTREYVRLMCKLYGWPLLEYKTPESYEEIVLQYGFPGPGQHQTMYIRLKERAIRQLVRDHTPQEGTQKEKRRKIMFLTGVRREESVRRMGHVQPMHVDGRCVWVAPIVNWTKLDVMDYVDSQAQCRNLVVDLLHLSGECLCGSYAEPDEFAEIKLWYPETAAYLERLQLKAKAANVPCVWGVRPPTKRQQKRKRTPYKHPLCASCDARFSSSL